MKLRNFFFFAGSTVNRLDAVAISTRRWMRKEVRGWADKSQSDIEMLRFCLFFEVRAAGDDASWPIKGHNYIGV